MDIPPVGTICALLFFVVIGLIPMIPVVARLVIVIAVGLGLYFGMDSAMFNLPYGDDLPMSAIYGGSGGSGGFNKYALGVLGPVIGIIFTVIGAVLQKVLGKKE